MKPRSKSPSTRSRQNRLYFAFVLSMVAHLSLATFYLEGVNNLPVVFLLVFNYIFSLVGRDRSLGFRLFFLENRIERESLKPKRLFLFGVISKEKDPIQKSTGLFKKISDNKLKFLRILLFNVWVSFNIWVVVPKFGGQFSMALFLGFFACWIILVSFQLPHFLLVFLISFFMVLLSLLKTGGAEPLLYVPYLILFFASLSFYRKIAKKPSYKNKDKRARFSWGGSFYQGINFGFLLVLMSFFMFHFLERLEEKTKPKIEEAKKEISEKVQKYAEEKVEEFLDGQAGTQGNPRRQTGPSKNSKEELGKIQKMAEKMSEEKKMKELKPLLKKMEQKKKDFLKASQDYKKTGSQFDNLKRRQAQGDVDDLRRQMNQIQKRTVEDDKELKQMISKHMEAFQDEGLKFEKDLEQRKEALHRKVNLATADLKELKQEFKEKKESGSSEQEQKKLIKEWTELSEKINELKDEKKQVNRQLSDFKGAREASDSTQAKKLASQEDGGGEGSEKPLRTSGEVQKKQDLEDLGQQRKTSNSDPSQEEDLSSDQNQLDWFNFDNKIPQFNFDLSKILEPLKGLIYILLGFAALVFGIYFFNSLKAREVTEKIKKQVGLTPEKKKVVKRKYGALRQRRLKPNEEVVYTYKMFLETMALADFPKEKWRTVTEFYWEVDKEFVDMEESVGTITELFCKQRYGKKDITPEEVAILRKARDRFIKRMVA